MNSDESKLCDSCYARHTTNAAVIWCPHCGEGFCSNCGECHNTSKVGKFHETITIDNFQKLPTVVSEIQTSCAEHEEIFELYCQQHRQCLCLSCFKGSHEECKDVTILRDVIKNVKSSAAVEDIEMCLRDITEIFSKLKDNRLENKRRLEEQKTEYLDKFKQLRLTINNHLDKLENEIVEKISSEVENIKLRIDHILEEIQERNEKVNKLQEDIASVKEMSSELQVFLGLKKFQDIVNDETEYLAKMQREGNVNDIDIECDISVPLSSFCDEIESLGNFRVSQKPGSLTLIVGKRERAQYMLPKEISLVGVKIGLKRNISYTPDYDEEVRDTCANGCTILHNGSILYTDHKTKTLVLSNGSNIFRDIVSLESIYDVAYTGSSEVVVTTPDTNEIIFIDLLLGTKIKSVCFESTCRGIDCIDQMLVVKIDGLFLITDIQGNVTSRIKTNCLSRVTMFENKIFGTNSKKNTVSCYDTDGTILWQFEDETMQSPGDVTTDENGYLYVACKKSNNVVVVSPDGKSCKEILNKSDGLDSPYAIHFEKTLKKLLVCNNKQGAILCDMV